MYSIIVPVYNNESSIPDLLHALSDLTKQLDGPLEVVFVVDGSPDQSHTLLKANLPSCPFRSSLILHSKNFGSFSAVRTGLEQSSGPYFGVMAADLQEPPQLLVEVFRSIREGHDVVIGQRDERNDPWHQRLVSGFFWWFYRRFIQSEMPEGGADIFGCNDTIRRHLLSLKEANTTLIGLVVWLGFNRKIISYKRLPRHSGKSAWSFRKKIHYTVNSILAFSDFPLQFLVGLGVTGLLVTLLGAAGALYLKMFSSVQIPSSTFTLIVIAFFGGLNCLGFGVVGSYVWRAFENTKGRPDALVMKTDKFPGR